MASHQVRSVMYGLVKTAQMAKSAGSERSGERWNTVPGSTALSASGDLAKIAEMVVGKTESGRSTANRETSVGGSVLYEDSHSPGYYMLAHRSPENESLTAYLKLSPEQAATKDFDTSNLIGYASSQPIATGHREINSLYVDPAHRRKGIAHTLLGFHKNLHSGESLHVIPDPFKDRSVSRENIEKLYAKHGFVPHENNPRAMYFPAQTKTAAAQASSQNNTNKKYIVPALGAAGAAALGYGIHRTAPYYKAKADNLGTWVQALDNRSPDLHILNGVHSATDPDVGPRVMRMVSDPVKKGKTVHGDARVRSNIYSRKPSFSVEITNSGQLDSVGRKAPFAAAGSLPTKDLESWGETLKAKMHGDAAAFGRTLDPNDVNSAVDAIVDAHRKNPFRRAAAFAEDAVDHLKNNKTKYLIGGALAAGAAFGGKKLYDRYKQRNTQGQ